MRDVVIQLPPFEFIHVIDCKIRKGLNEHATLKLSARISLEQEEALLDTPIKHTDTSLLILDEQGDKKKIFTGMVKDFSIQNIADSRVLQLDIVSATYLMDHKKRVRVFQEKTATYEAVINKLNTYGDYGCILSSGDGVAIEHVIVQYNETDFEFIKRLASHFHTSICPAYLAEGVKFYFGIPNGGKSIPLEKGYTIKKELKEDLRKDEQELPFAIEKGNHVIDFSHREVYEIGDYTTLKGQKFTICEINSEWTGNEMVHHYHLKEEMGQYVSKCYNAKIIGASLQAKITAVSKDKVKLYVHEDGLQERTDFLPYSTVYSSPDGTGWYCMPEEGDSIRMYFPTEKEEHGYAISAVHVEEESPSAIEGNDGTQGEERTQQGSGEVTDTPRSNPDHKSLKSKYGKEVLFTPTTLMLTNNDGTTILIDDNDGISIMSPNKVLLESEEEIEMTSIGSSINMVSTELIRLEQSDSTIEVKDNIEVLGAKVQLE